MVKGEVIEANNSWILNKQEKLKMQGLNQSKSEQNNFKKNVKDSFNGQVRCSWAWKKKKTDNCKTFKESPHLE